MAFADRLRNSEYLINNYIEAASALRDFEEFTEKRDSKGGRRALSGCAGIICDTFGRLSNDIQFWDTLAALKGDINQRREGIERHLDEIELFIKQEERVFQDLQLPPVFFTKLLADVSLVLKTVRSTPSPDHIDEMREGIGTARDAICKMRDSLKSETDTGLFTTAITTREALGVLGGATTIVVNGISATAVALLPLASIVGGIASSLTFLNWMKRNERRRE